MRCFFAVEPSAQTKLAIEHWRQKYLPPFTAPVSAANFHLTLAFLGEISAAQFESLSQLILNNHSAQLTSFNLTLNTQGYWPKPKAFWLGCDNVPAQLLALVKITEQAARSAHLNFVERNYIPHLTLARKCKTEPPLALLPPNFTTQISEFGLYESVSTANGVRYFKRLSWPL
ncbi:RNA 2',3'-cyclic phosphodiesterase [Catenovulum sp. 2E275]|uniref:RNA 2',3'-cyclic phosphodiesterase n=1 Tax=Catenovulum sp. 2E275 TaxID=2980497 RepID=UPI0021D0ADF7|nr:RNA 2',3'-cyclic phosphodiesterase [Catenovulum sp. 2E275]MCU4676624.1 RNA 2',3'-cyclic phosphodiesterase [Catenovulum sp. 2E275]